MKAEITKRSISHSNSYLEKYEKSDTKKHKGTIRSSSCNVDQIRDQIIKPKNNEIVSRNEATIIPKLNLDLKESGMNVNELEAYHTLDPKKRNNIEFNNENPNLQALTLNDLNDLDAVLAKKTHIDSAAMPPKHNIYDIKSQKKLQYVLRNGYSYKFHEKKHYNTYQKKGKSHIESPSKIPNNNKQNSDKMPSKEISLLAQLKSIFFFSY